MDAAVGTRALRRLAPLRPGGELALVRITAALLTGALVVSAILLATRRFSGALTETLSPVGLIGTALVVSAAAFVAELLQRQIASKAAAVWSTVGNWLILLSLPIVALSISLPHSSPIGLLLMWFVVAIAEAGLWNLGRAGKSAAVAGRSVKVGDRLPTPAERIAEIEPAPLNVDETTQKLVYRRTVAGSAEVEGTLRVDFIPGQRVAFAHVAFCPAFLHAPAVEAELLEGPAAEIRPTLVLPWGIRWEVKLDRETESATRVELSFYAIETSEAERAM